MMLSLLAVLSSPENVEPRCQNSPSGQDHCDSVTGTLDWCVFVVAWLPTLKLTTLKRRAMKTNETDLVRMYLKKSAEFPCWREQDLYGKRRVP